MKKFKVLYVFGYGDSPDSKIVRYLKKNLNNKKFEVISDYYAQYNPKEAVYDLEHIIKENKIDILIGENLGAYLIATLDNDLIKVLMNPIYDPIVELAEYETTNIDKDGKEVTMKLVPPHIIKFYTENKMNFANFDNTFCVFNTNDNYKEYANICKNTSWQDKPLDTIIEYLNKID